MGRQSSVGKNWHSRGTGADYSRLPLAGWPDIRKVLGNRPVPQSLNVPKSLYQSPSGTSGSCDFQSANSNRSSIETLRSLARSRRWAHFSRGILLLDFGHASAAKDQSTKLVQQPVLLARIVTAAPGHPGIGSSNGLSRQYTYFLVVT